jgi:membrane associated rhomboid family serine protease/Zn-finger nucleic acid-binding protein
MLICPISGFRMRQARARGGSFWYCPHSRGRAVTLEMAKKFLGDDAARELWVRSEFKYRPSQTLCPSCTRPMRQVSTPGWMGAGEIDVCRLCHFIWVNPGDFPAVPQPEDLITPAGDSTLLKDKGDAAKDFLLLKESAAEAKDTIVGQGPDEFLRRLPAFLGLPVELENPRRVSSFWVTAGLSLAMIALHFISAASNLSLTRSLGFYPSDPLRNAGANMIASIFLHGSWFHLFFNIYFFLMFSDDVEEDLGFWKYSLFIVSIALVCSVSMVLLSANPDSPHVGLSGVVMAFMTYYAFQFPKARLAYIFPVVHTLSVGGGSAWIRTFKWYRVPVWIVFAFYVLKDLIQYLISERNHLTYVSHSAHLGGIVAGLAFWVLFSKIPRQTTTVPARA